MDGINEKGLAIGAMGCMGIDSKNNNPVVLSTEIIRIVLDNAENVNDAIAIFKKYSLHNIVVPLHYLVSDAAGTSVIIEYINGSVEVQDLNQSSKVLTNFKYYGSQDSITNKTNEYRASGKISKDVFGDSYLRYIKIKQKLIASSDRLNDTESMNLLKDVSMKKKSMYGDFYTVWSVVYNLTSKVVNVSVGRNYDKLYTFKLSD
jgi:penicillin V acylase-like amidase (Ntn superfamily)